MILRLDTRPAIDNLRNYPSDIIERLGAVLRSGAVATPDPRRKDFYDVIDGERVFFIHISPVSGKVWLLATWQAEASAQMAAPFAAHAAAGRYAAAGHFC